MHVIVTFSGSPLVYGLFHPDPSLPQMPSLSTAATKQPVYYRGI